MQYIKMLIMSFVSAIFQPLCASSSAHFAFLNRILGFTEDGKEALFYLSIISFVFSLCSIIVLRKVYAKNARVIFTQNGKKEKNSKAYIRMTKGMLISLVPAMLMFIPISKEKFLFDVMADYLVGVNTLVTAFCTFIGGFILIIGVWYAKNKRRSAEKYNNPKLTDIVKMTVYQIPTMFFPGLSNTAMAAVNFELSGLEEYSIMRDSLIYTMPSVMFLSAARIIRIIISGLRLDYIAIAVCAVGAMAASFIMLNLVKKVNIRRTYTFFSVYSIIFGLCIGVFSFI